MRARAAAAALGGVAAVLFAAVVALLLAPLMLAGAVAGPPPLPACGPGGTAQLVGSVQLDAEQMGNAQTVVAVTAGRRLPAYAATVALATVAAESMFHNYPVSRDADSLGLFQQRAGYYTAAVAASPARATNAFLDRLVATRGWASRPRRPRPPAYSSPHPSQRMLMLISVGRTATPSSAKSRRNHGYVRSLWTMNPLSTADTLPPGVATSWVWA